MFASRRRDLITKREVWVTEMLQMVANHSLQIHGGYGYMEEYPAERAYRDAALPTKQIGNA